MRTKHLLLAATAFTIGLGVTACKVGDKAGTEQVDHSASGINLAAMDKSVKPGDDFYAYANGTWMKNTQIPDDRSSIGGFLIADQKREADTKALFDEILKADHDAGSNEQKIKDYYNAYLNTDAIDKAGLAPAKADLDAIAAITDKASLSRVIGTTLRADTDPLNATNYETPNLFGIFISQGLNTPGETIPYLMQGGLGMPEREYYLGADNAELRTKYRTFVETVMQAAGNADPKAAADRIIGLETKIAQAHVDRATSEDFKKGATVWTRAELEQKAPGIDWTQLLNAAQLGGATKFQAYHAGAIPKLSALVASQPVDAWKDWLTFHTLANKASVLPKPIRDASFAFNGTALAGTPPASLSTAWRCRARRPSGRATSARSTRRRTRSRTRSARPTPTRSSRPRRRPTSSAWSTRSSRPSRPACRASNGWRRRPRRKRSRRSRPWPRASATPSSGPTIRA